MSTTSTAPPTTVVVTLTAADTTVTATQPDRLKSTYKNKKPCAIFFKTASANERISIFNQNTIIK